MASLPHDNHKVNAKAMGENRKGLEDTWLALEKIEQLSLLFKKIEKVCHSFNNCNSKLS